MNILSRRNFLKRTFGSVVAASLFPAHLRAAQPAQPNILWLSCEDISPHLGCYGQEYAITPNIDQLATEGVRYTRAFTVHGVCAPSRSGIITGMHPSSLGSVNMRCRALKPDSIKCFTEYLRADGYYCTNNSKEDYNFKTPKAAWDQSSSKAHWKNRPPEKPFFAVFNFTGTHESKLWNSADFDNTHPPRLKPSQWQKPENMTVPPIYPDTLAVRRDFARLFERITEFDYFVKDKIDELKQAGLYENTIIFIWSDHGDPLPRAKRCLYDSGTLVPLIVRIPEPFRTNNQGKPNTTDDRFINFIDLGSTVLNLTGLPVPKHMQGQPFLGPNLPPPRKYIFGARQRIDELFDMVRSVRDEQYRYIRNFMPFVPYLPFLQYSEKCNTLKSLRNLHAQNQLNNVQAQWLSDHRPAEELYDLKNDPWETHNLAQNPQYTNVQNQLRTVLENWMIETRDTGLIPEPEMIRLAQQYGGEYLIFQQTDGKQRIEKLLKLAILASQPQSVPRTVIEPALKDSDPLARYWAVLAMRGLAINSQNDIEKIHQAGKDKNPCVRIAAAWTLHLLGKNKNAVAILENELKQLDQPEEVLHFAIHVLDTFGPESRPALQTVKALYAAKKKNNYIERVGKHFIEKFQK
ncbi:MAG: sulfatase-like hydrolase/transferase [Sedimentisphaerales bacterium]|nr:sulfatase-like hydrolase/transferase [Sedimentisphaerales bacterium]